jgi:haloalkane dehalogenase
MTFATPTSDELSPLRADPLLAEQELAVPPDVVALKRATATRAGRVYWRSPHDHLYALEITDRGGDRPVLAMIYGYWHRDEPRPPDHEIAADLRELCGWLVGGSAHHLLRMAPFAHGSTSWPDGSVLRTPEGRFNDLPDFPYAPQYVEVEGLRMAYVEQGTGDPIVMLHGEPTWGYLYRHMISPLAEVGRVVVPDLIGFGRSDKPMMDHAYSYKAHVRWLRGFIDTLDLRRITLICQDWGGLIGLRVVAQRPERFLRLVAMNTDLPEGRDLGEPFLRWRRFVQQQRELDIPRLMRRAVRRRTLSDREAAAYGAPFPSAAYQMGALVFPRLVPIHPDHPGAYDNRVAIATLRTLDLPVLLPWADGDPITGPWEAHLRSLFRRVAPPLTIKGAGHFLQEDAGAEIADHIRRWMAQT